MNELIVHTFDWVPEMARGYVRDLRVRWALEEAGMPYRVVGVPFRERGAEHFAHQPFGQVPWLTDGEISIFETGAILLHLAERSEKLMPHDARGRADVIQWAFAALNSIEMASLPWGLFKFENDDSQTPGKKLLDKFLAGRLGHMEKVLATREWLAGNFSIADIQMADALRLVDSFGELGEYKASKT
ncbi:MAG: glutathione S-transferase family protein, partial [Proteobacteria bacterium]|nr:glutathione S-transferase family protein [Pseudomonadota bacterium]